MVKQTYHWIRAGIWIGMFALASCSQIALKQEEINASLYQGDVQKAYDVLNQDIERWKKNRNALLYYWNKGNMAWMLGRHQESSELFMTSDYFLEDMYRNYANVAASLFTNDKVRQYQGEDHERLLFQYYQILNFMKLGNQEYALVQARRLQLELQRLDDRYKGEKEGDMVRYHEDAFAYLLIGLVYESAKELDNAYVAYKNAYRIYSDFYSNALATTMPEQFKKDIMRLAYHLGHPDDLARYEKELGVSFDRNTPKYGGNTVFFWNNGLSPVKEEISLDFTIIRGKGAGWVLFTNNQYGYTIPVFIGTDHTADGSAFSNIEFVRATFPKYFTRGAFFHGAELEANGATIPLELAEDVSQIAHKELSDRFLKEIGKTLARLALKKASEYQLRKENPEAGAALGLLNMITEQADTRSWESMPHQISYTRTNLPTGAQSVVLRTFGPAVSQDHPIQVYVPKEGMSFVGFHTLQPGNPLP